MKNERVKNERVNKLIGTNILRITPYRNDILLSGAALAHSSLALAVVAAPGVESQSDFLTLSEGQTERDAVLLECCDLPDKGLTLSEGDLDGIVSRFTGPVPLKLEHIDTPLGDMGTVQKIWREGRRLLGKIVLAADAADLVLARGCKGLSCGLSRAPHNPKSLTLAELSLVLKPRVQAAVLLSDDDAAELVRLRSESEALRSEVVQQRVNTQIADLKRAGKIIPATEAAARVLLSAGDAEVVTLASGGAQGVSAAFMAYLSAQPAVVVLSEMAPDATRQDGLYGSADGDGGDDVTLTDEEQHFLSKSLGVDPVKVAETMTADRKRARTSGAAGSGHHGTSPASSHSSPTHPQKGHRV